MIRSRRELLAVFLVFALLTLAFARPLPSRMSREIPISGSDVEPMPMLYGITWGANALSENSFHYYQAPFFHPHEASLALIDQTFGLAILAAPVNWSTGNMFLGYNAVWLLTFFLSGVGAYLLARHLTDNGPAAVLAGIVYAFHPFRFENAGLVNVLAMMWIPFALLCLHLWVVTHRKRQLFLFTAFALLQLVSGGYGAVFLLLAVVLYFGVLLLVRRRPTWRLLVEQRWILLAAGAIVLILAAPFMAPYLEFARSGIGVESTLEETRTLSATPRDLLRFPTGPVALLLAATALILRGGRSRYRAEILFYAVLVVASLLLSLGPGASGMLPFSAFHLLIPGASFLHVPARFWILASLGLAVLSASGLALLVERARAWPGGIAPHVVGVLACVLAVVEVRPAPVALARPLPHGIPEIYTWLGNTGGKVTILELPMPRAGSPPTAEHARYQIYSLVHGNRLVNGVAGFVPPATARVRKAMERFPDGESVALLRNLGVTYVLLHEELYDREEFRALAEAVQQSRGLGVVVNTGPVWVLEVVPEGVGASLRRSERP